MKGKTQYTKLIYKNASYNLPLLKNDRDDV